MEPGNSKRSGHLSKREVRGKWWGGSSEHFENNNNILTAVLKVFSLPRDAHTTPEILQAYP